MNVYPLKSLTLQQAQDKQFELIDCITREFTGSEFLDLGDLGVCMGTNKPRYAGKVEKVLANFFHAEKALLVTGSGTGALRWGLSVILQPNETLLVHTANIYPTTETSIKGLSIQTVRANFNDCDDIKKVMAQHPEIKAALVQYSRQGISDSYDIQEVIATIKSCKDIPILTDDNYAALKVEKIGIECGADISGFSCFKLLGPEGVGLVLGKAQYIDAIEKQNYSGGSKVQGWQAMEVLRGMVYAPVALAIQAQEAEKLVVELNKGINPMIKNAFIANAQSKVLIVELNKPIAKAVLKEAEKLGALPNPVGSESKYEMVPLFYKVSGTFLKEDPTRIDTMIRINPNRASAKTVIRILEESIQKVEG